MEKDIPCKWKFLKSLATTFTSGKLDFKTKSIRKANKGIKILENKRSIRELLSQIFEQI